MNLQVFFTGFRQENIRQLYVSFIRDLFKNTVVDEENLDSVKISFDTNSEKVFVTFDTNQGVCSDNRYDWDTKQCSLPGKTLPEVYKAVKFRKMNLSTRIPLMKYNFTATYNKIRLVIQSHLYCFRIENERKVAEQLGIGFMTDSTFTMKGCVREDTHKLCIPKTMQKEIIGTITHVRTLLHWIYFVIHICK